MAFVQLAGKEKKVNNIFCIGRNYAEHIRELNHQPDAEMTVFMKPNAALLAAGGQIILPEFSASVHFECELLLLIEKKAATTKLQNPLDWIAGFGIGLDLTARDVQNRCREKGLPWLKSKGFRHSACISDFILPKQLPSPYDELTFTLSINDQLRQRGYSGNMIYSMADIIRQLDDWYGLQDGDIIFTGTPEGVGALKSGDQLALDLQGVLIAEFTVA